MSEMEQTMMEMEILSKSIQLKLAKGEYDWGDETVQFFIPVILNFTSFDWLKLIAEHNLVEEDERVVKNFLEMVQGLMEVNASQLTNSVADKLKKMFGDD